jgi:hypothetical protein
MAGFESSLERDLLLLLDFDPEVSSYEEQPVRIDYRDAQGHARHYTPDVLITWRRDGLPPHLVEVKYRADLKTNRGALKPRFKAAYCHARQRGWRFRILTEVEIRTPYLRNVKFLSAYRRLNRDGASAALLLEALHRLHATTPEALLAAVRPDLGGRAALLPMLWALVAEGKAGVDLTLPLTMRSRLWWPDPDEARTATGLPAWQRQSGGRKRTDAT